MEDYQNIYEAMKEHFKSETALERAQTAYENTNWKIGDATIEDCGPTGKRGISNGSEKKIQEAAKALTKKLNREITPKFLQERRDISCIYPNPDRSGFVSWTVYAIFRGYPEHLLEWVKANPSGRGMSAATARTIVADLKKQAKDAQVEEGKPEETKPEETTVAAGGGEDGSATIEETKDEETSETDKENSEEETQPLAAKDEETNVTEEEGEPEPETAEEAEMRLSAEKRAKEEAARCKTEDLTTVAKEIARFVQGNTDISIAWNREAQENIKVALKDLNWTLKQLKSREKGLVDATASEKPARRSRSKPNGAEEQQSAMLH
jgi:hypothetical protein